MVISRIFTLLVFISCWLILDAQAQAPPTWSRAVQLGGLEDDQVIAAAIDANGNTYHTGYFLATTRCGALSLTVASDASYDMYLAKLDAQGNVLWLRQAGSKLNGNMFGLAQGSQVVVDATGNVYVSGFFKGSVTFGSAATTLSSTGTSPSVFLVKYSPQGTVLWAQQAQATTSVDATGLTLTANGDLFVAGTFKGVITVGTTTFISQNATLDAFLAKYDANGAFQWAQTARGPGDDYAYNLQPGPANSVYLSGNFTSSFSSGNTTITGVGQSDVFIAQFDNAGTVQWMKAYGGPGIEYGGALAIAPTGEIYCTGSFSSTAQFGSQTLTSAGGLDGFLLKCTAQGVPVWARQMGGAGNDYAPFLQRQAAGALYVGGSFTGTGTFASQTLISAGSYDAFLARYDANGALLWATRAGGPQYDSAGGLSLSAGGGIEFDIQFTGTAQFGALTATSRGITDVLFCHLQDNTALASHTPAFADALTVYPNPVSGDSFQVTGITSSIQPVTMKLRDLVGRLVMERQLPAMIVPADKFVVETVSLCNGTYLLEISDREGTSTQKIVIRR